MVKLLDLAIESIKDSKRNVRANLVADTKDEVIACGTSGANIVGLTADDTMVLGSMAICADGGFGILSSNGQWNFQ